MIQYKVTIPQTHCTVVHVHVFQSTKKFGFAVSFLPHLATQQKERERVRKKAIHPFTSPDQVTVYILSCEFQNGYFFIHETSFFFFPNKSKVEGILVISCWVIILFFKRRIR